MTKQLALIGAVVITIGATAPAGAATLTLTGSTFTLAIGSLPPLTIPQSVPIPIFVSSAGGSFVEPAGIFASTVLLNTGLFTGVPLISGLSLSASNASKIVGAGGGPAGGFGGTGAINGQLVIGVLGGVLNLTLPLSVVGAGGSTKIRQLPATITTVVTGHLWTTGPAVVTGIRTTTPGGMSTVINVTLSGSDARTAGHKGTLTLVTPIRLNSNGYGALPAFGIQTLHFVPEPGTLLLIGSGAIALVWVGRGRRLR